MQQYRNNRNNGNIYDLRKDLQHTPPPSQQKGSSGSADGHYGFNGEPLSFAPDRTANGTVRRTRTDNSIEFPSQPRRTEQSGTRRTSGQNRNRTAQRSRTAQPEQRASGTARKPQQRRSQGQKPRKTAAQAAQQRYKNQRLRPAQQQPRDPVQREKRKKRRLTRAALKRRRMLRRLMAFVTLLAVIAAGVYLTMTMLFKIGTIQVQTADGTVVQEVGGYSSSQILQALGVQTEENIFSFDPAAKEAELEKQFPLLESIRVVRDYPNTVVVQVTEAVPAYAVQNGNKWLVISDKWKILSEESTQPEGLCTLYGGKLQDTAPGQGFRFVDDADAASASGSETAESESAVSTETARMEALRTLRSKLEEYGLSQDVTRLEVADTEQLAFLYQDRISVLLGTLNDLDYKLDRARYVLTNADGKGCGPTDTGRLDFSHTSASSTRKIYFAQGEPTLPSGYVVPPKAEEPAPAEDAADSTDSAESTDTADTTEPAAETDTEQLPLTHPDRMTANEEENPM